MRSSTRWKVQRNTSCRLFEVCSSSETVPFLTPRSQLSPQEYITQLIPNKEEYSDFNLICGVTPQGGSHEDVEVWYFSNRDPSCVGTKLEPGDVRCDSQHVVRS